MATESKAGVATTQVYEVYIKAAPEAIWDAITSKEWTVKYGYQGAIDMELRPGGAYRAHSTADMKAIGLPDVVVDGGRRIRRAAAKASAHVSLPLQPGDEGRRLHARHVGN